MKNPYAQTDLISRFHDISTILQTTNETTSAALRINLGNLYKKELSREESRRICQYYAQLHALYQKLGWKELQTWLDKGQPSQRDLLLHGKLEETVRSADEIIFAERPPDNLGYQSDYFSDEELAQRISESPLLALLRDKDRSEDPNLEPLRPSKKPIRYIDIRTGKPRETH